MSIYAVGKIKLNINLDNPVHRQILEKALEKVAKVLEGKVIKNAVVTGFTFSKPVPYLIHVNLRYGNGYGVEVRDGEIIVHADIHGAKYHSTQVARMIAQEYVTESVLYAAKKLNKKVQLKRVENKNVVYVYEV